MYRLGITPWDREVVPRRLIEVLDEHGSPGTALDLGCGTGRDGVYLAERGWTVTGIDGVSQAIDAAGSRARKADVEVSWLLGDVTALESLRLEGPFDLVLDRGCFHGLSADQRRRCAAGVNALTEAGAQLLMFSFQPRRIGLGPAGVTAEQVRDVFGQGWDLLSVVADVSAGKLPLWLGDTQPAWYLLARR
jgi:SAM-dependent methyltransferase